MGRYKRTGSYSATGTCITCGEQFEKRSPAHKWCDKCKYKKVECPTCGKVFTRNFVAQKYCSDSCCTKSRIKEVKEKTCPKCGKIFRVSGNAHGTKQKYCSALCAKRGGKRKGKEIPCDVCKTIFYCSPKRLKNKHHFCSRECYSLFQKNTLREFNWNTRKGKAKTRRAFDSIWRKKALKAANYMCEYCGSKEKLNVHHAISRKNYSTRWYLPNSVVLCVKHHMWDRDISAHGNSIAFSKWILEQRGVAWWEDIMKQKNDIWSDWKSKIDNIRNHLDGERIIKIKEKLV